MPQYTYPDDFEGTFWTVVDGAYYVSTVGNDITGNGSPRNPFLTVEKAFSLALDGEKIVIGPDEYVSYAPSDITPGGAHLPCRLATTENFDLSSGGLQEIDDVPTQLGDRILVWKQTDQKQNGIYEASDGSWTRASDFNATISIVSGKLVPVLEGTANGQKTFRHITTGSITLDVTEIEFLKAAITHWGELEGSLSDQEDLDAALTLKADKSNVLERDNTGTYTPSADYHPATKKFVEDQIASLDKATPKGLMDCSANPNYPAGTLGDYYYVSVEGKIGGASGPTAQFGDKIQCIADNAGGTHASVGSSWIIFQGNLDKATTTEAEGGTDDEKYLTSKKGYDGWYSWINSKTVSELNTAAKVIVGAINELHSGKASSVHNHDASQITPGTFSEGSYGFSGGSVWNYQNPTDGVASLGWEDNYLRYRFGGTATPLGIRLDHYDSVKIILNRTGQSSFVDGITTSLFDVDNLRLDGNMLSSSNINGNIILSPNGSGIVDVTNSLCVAGTLTINSPVTPMILKDTGESAGSGYWRIINEANRFRLDKATGALDDFTEYGNLLNIGEDHLDVGGTTFGDYSGTIRIGVNNGNVSVGSTSLGGGKLASFLAEDSNDTATMEQYAFSIVNPLNATNEEVGIAFRISSAWESYTPGAAISHERTGPDSVGKLHFKTRTGTGTSTPLATALTIDNQQNVGIGVVSPVDKLHIQGTGVNVGVLIEETAGSHNSFVRFRRSAQDWYIGQIGDGDFKIVDNLAEGGETLAVQIDGAGRIGFGAAPIAGVQAFVNGVLRVGSLNFPTADGTSGQALITNGSGTLSFASVSSGGISNIEDSGSNVRNSSSGTGYFQWKNLRMNGNTLQSINTNGNILFAPNGSGKVDISSNLTVGGTGTAADWIATSDERLKSNMEGFGAVLERIALLKGKFSKFKWKESGSSDIGYSAQSVLAVFPEIVNVSKENILGLSYGKLGGIALEGIAELNEELLRMRKEMEEIRDCLLKLE